MLILVTSMRQLRLGELMAVYAASLEEKATDWPDLPRGFALQLAEQDFRAYLHDVFFRTPGAVLALWEANGTYASALRLEPYKDGLLLEALETIPDRRKLGCAAALIQAVQAHLASLGPVKLYSHVSKRNVASMRTHETCGFTQLSDHAIYINGSVDCRCCTLLYES